MRPRVLGWGLVGLLILASTACGEDDTSAGGGGSGAPALQGLLTEAASPPSGEAATPTTLGDGAEGFEHSTNALRVLGDDPELDELAVDCHQGDLSSCDVLYVGSPEGSLYEAYGATCGARIDQLTHRLCADVLVGDPTDPPSTGDDFLDELARQCSAGDMVDCDLLYAESDTGSEAERYGATCGGRLQTDDDCAQLVT
jgi:hypothetical protein